VAVAQSSFSKKPPAQLPAAPKVRRWLIPSAIAVLHILVVAALLFLRQHHSQALTEKDSILIADFLNTTGEAVFDGTLKQALAVQLQQSHSLTLFPNNECVKR
jgi:hypothetical protein